MWKSIILRHPLRRSDAKGAEPPQRAAAGQDGPFADLMAKLDQIPYRRQRKRAFDC